LRRGLHSCAALRLKVAAWRIGCEGDAGQAGVGRL